MDEDRQLLGEHVIEAPPIQDFYDIPLGENEFAFNAGHTYELQKSGIPLKKIKVEGTTGDCSKLNLVDFLEENPDFKETDSVTHFVEQQLRHGGDTRTKLQLISEYEADIDNAKPEIAIQNQEAIQSIRESMLKVQYQMPLQLKSAEAYVKILTDRGMDSDKLVRLQEIINFRRKEYPEAETSQDKR